MALGLVAEIKQLLDYLHVVEIIEPVAFSARSFLGCSRAGSYIIITAKVIFLKYFIDKFTPSTTKILIIKVTNFILAIFAAVIARKDLLVCCFHTCFTPVQNYYSIYIKNMTYIIFIIY